MSLPQFATKDVASTVRIHLTSRPAADPTVAIYTDADVEQSTGTATRSTVNTTLASAASAGDRSIAVADASAVTQGSTVWVQGEPEEVRVRVVSGNTIYLRTPLLNDQATGSAVEGTMCTYAIPAADLDTLGWDWRIKWTVDGEIYWSAMECILYPIRRHATTQDLFAIDSHFADRLDRNTDVEATLDDAFEDVLIKIGAVGRARCFPASEEFNKAVALQWWANFWRGIPGDDEREMYERYKSEVKAAIDQVTTTTPRDANQNGIIEENERLSMNSITIGRG